MSEERPAELLGLASASIAGAFTTSPSVVSLLYDAMTLSWTDGGPAPARMPETHFGLLASPAARGRAIAVTLNGFAQPQAGAALILEIGGTRQIVTPETEGFSIEVAATLSADADTTPVKLTFDLKAPAEASTSLLQLDSIDVLLPPCADDERAT